MVKARTYLRRLVTYFALALLIAPLAVAPAPSLAAPIVMKIGSATLNDQQHEWMKRFKAAVERDSNGRIEVQIYPASQLGSIPREIEDTQFGAIQAWIGPPEFLTGVDARYGVPGAPALFTTPQQADRTMQDPAFNAAMLGLGANKGLKGISIFYYAQNGFIMRKPVHTVDDLKNTKIRDFGGPLQDGMVAVLGGAGVPMPLDQVLPALQQGAIDGSITGITTGYSLKYFDVAKYFVEFNPSSIVSIAVVSKQWFDALAPDLQKIIVDDGKSVGRGMLPFTLSFISQAAAGWTAGGGEIVHPSPAVMQVVRAREATVAHDALKDKPDVLQLYDLAVKTAAKYK
jgi:TRAP-type C4-dicarboxylate transport system substrate-binding protein